MMPEPSIKKAKSIRLWHAETDNQNSYHAITPARVHICPLIVSVEEKQLAQEIQLFFSSVNMEGNQTHFN